MWKVLWAAVLFVPVFASAGTFISGGSSLPADKTFGRACSNPDPTKCVTSTDYNAVTGAAYDLRTHGGGWRDANDHGAVGDGSADDTAHLTALLASGLYHLTLPDGAFKTTATLTVPYHASLSGSSKYKAKLVQSGTGPALAMTWADSYGAQATWERLWVHGNASSGDACIDYRNSASLPSNSASHLTFRDLYVDNCGADGLHIVGIKPSGGEGNVYSTELERVFSTGNASHGLHLDSVSAAGAAGTVLTLIQGSSFTANTGYGIYLDTTATGTATAHGLTNVIATDMEGNGSGPMRVDSANNLNLWGNYAEQPSSVSAMIDSGNHKAVQGPWTLIGNQLGNSVSATIPYCVDFGSFPTGQGTIGVFAAGNTLCTASVAAYRIAGLQGAQLGPDRSQTGIPLIDWTNLTGVKMVQVWDIANNTWSFFSDGANFIDQPRVGFGVTGPNVAAYLHVAGTQPYQATGNGTNATDIVKLAGTKGGATTGTTGQTAGNGASATITAGAGGNAPSGSTNGNGGNVTISSGAAGSGAGSAGAAGDIILNGGIGQGTALQHKRVTTGSVTAGARATVTVSWTTSFVDTDYTVICSVYDASTAGPALSVERVMSQAVGSITVQVLNSAAGDLTGTLHCVGMHD